MKKIFLAFSIYSIYVLVTLTRFIFSFYQPKKNNKSIAFFACFSSENAGFNYRVKTWADILKKNGYNIKIFQTYSHYEIASLPFNFNKFLIKGMILRYIQIIRSIKYKNVVVRRELLLYNEYGNLFYEKLLLKIHPEAILDFDDHISLAKKEPRKVSFFGKILLENGNKFSHSTEIYKNFIVGNNFLSSLLKKTANKIILPTCVNYELNKNYKFYSPNKINIGWIGSNGNQKYLNLIIEDLNKLSIITEFKLTVISGKQYKNKNAKFEIINIPWSLKSEKTEISKFDFGVMPLTNETYTKGKCSFKAIQYMGIGVIPVISNVGMNNELVKDGIDGFLVNKNQWFEKFKLILSLDNKVLEKISKSAYNKILDNYSFKKNTSILLNYLKSINSMNIKNDQILDDYKSFK